MTSNLPAKPPQWTLSQVLGDKAVQREVIECAARCLFDLSQRRGSPSLLGSRPPKTAKKIKGVTVAALMAGNIDAQDRGPQIAGYLQSVAKQEEDALTLAWCAIASMTLFPECARQVAANTQVGWAPYFSGGAGVRPLGDRIIGLLMGDAQHMAMTPLQIVLSEWQLYDRLGR